jgi:hypothetical protein
MRVYSKTKTVRGILRVIKDENMADTELAALVLCVKLCDAIGLKVYTSCRSGTPFETFKLWAKGFKNHPTIPSDPWELSNHFGFNVIPIKPRRWSPLVTGQEYVVGVSVSFMQALQDCVDTNRVYPF